MSSRISIAGFPTLESAAALQMQTVQWFGGEPGIRSHDELETLLTAVREQPYDNVIDAAATLLRALALSPCFLDANKRMALGLTLRVLNANGYEVRVSDRDALRFVVEQVQMKRVSVEVISATLSSWLGRSSRQGMGQ